LLLKFFFLGLNNSVVGLAVVVLVVLLV